MSKLAQQLREAGFNVIATSEIKKGYSLDNLPKKEKKHKKKRKKGQR